MGGLNHFDAVIFDADGTLFDTEEFMRQAWIAVGDEMDNPLPGRDYLDYVGMNRATILARFRQEYGPGFDGEQFMTRCTQHLQQHIEEEGVPLKPGVREILAFLQERNIPIGMATSTHRVRTDRRLELSGLGSFFRAVVTGDEVSRGKPDPEIYRAVCEKLGVAPDRCLAVEDSRNGILSAHAAGLSVAMVPDMIPPSAELKQLLWAQVVSLQDLTELLK